jgi:uncharacterized YccA/Bax inhibitor family protein
MMRSSNPALNDNVFVSDGPAVTSTLQGTMTLQGTVYKTAFLLVLAIGAAALSWQLPTLAPTLATPAMVGGLIVGLITSLVIIFKQTTAPFLAPVYAFAEGLFLGAVSALMESVYPGIVLPAVCLTFGIAGSLLAAYTSGLIKATENFKLGIVAATGGIFIVYMITMVLRLMGMDMPFIHGAGPIGIGFSLFVVVLAALNLVLDFDFIEKGVEYGAPKHMEWYGAFGLMVTLVWLYLEILRLLSKLQSRN